MDVYIAPTTTEPESLTEEDGQNSSADNNAGIAGLFLAHCLRQEALPQEQLPLLSQDVTFDKR